MNEEPELLNDKDIARRLGFSREWVRLQRFHRRHGQDHVLTIDPVIVGSKPRYLSKDFAAWVHELEEHRGVAPERIMQP